MGEKQRFEPEPEKLGVLERWGLTLSVMLLGPDSIDPDKLRALRARAGVLHKFESPKTDPEKPKGFPSHLADYMRLIGRKRFKAGPVETAIENEIDRKEKARQDKEYRDSFSSDDT